MNLQLHPSFLQAMHYFDDREHNDQNDNHRKRDENNEQHDDKDRWRRMTMTMKGDDDNDDDDDYQSTGRIIFAPWSPTFISGWWFGTFFIFPYIWNNHPN